MSLIDSSVSAVMSAADSEVHRLMHPASTYSDRIVSDTPALHPAQVKLFWQKLAAEIDRRVRE